MSLCKSHVIAHPMHIKRTGKTVMVREHETSVQAHLREENRVQRGGGKHLGKMSLPEIVTATKKALETLNLHPVAKEVTDKNVAGFVERVIAEFSGRGYGNTREKAAHVVALFEQVRNQLKTMRKAEATPCRALRKSRNAPAGTATESTSAATIAKTHGQTRGNLRRAGRRPLHGYMDFRGLKIAVENQKGSSRMWLNPDDGTGGITHMKHPYGYIVGTIAVDGDGLDVYIGTDRDALTVYVVRQMKAPDFVEDDEFKVMLAFASKAAAKAAYLKQYSDPRFYGGIREMPFEEFRAEVEATGDVKFGNSEFVKAQGHKAYTRRSKSGKLEQIPAKDGGMSPGMSRRVATWNDLIAKHTQAWSDVMARYRAEKETPAERTLELISKQPKPRKRDKKYQFLHLRGSQWADTQIGKYLGVTDRNARELERFADVSERKAEEQQAIPGKEAFWHGAADRIRQHALRHRKELTRKPKKVVATPALIKKSRGHKAYSRRSKTGKLEQIPAKGVVKPKKPVREWLNLSADAARTCALERGIKVPPAWTDVQVATDPESHLQARGRDAKGVMQRIYAVQHYDTSRAEKFARVKAFTMDYPKLMKRIATDMDTREEATVLYLIAKTGFRVGGDTERGDVAAYGASTLQPGQVKVYGNRISFSFTGKKGVTIVQQIQDKKLAQIFKVAPPKGRGWFTVTDHEVRGYLGEIGSGKYLVKDFRTHVANEEALKALKTVPAPKDDKERKKAIRAVSEAVAKKLGNQWTMARDSYISPEVWDQWK